MNLQYDGPEALRKSHVFDDLNFALAGILTCFSLAFEIGGSVVYLGPRRGPDWVLLAPTGLSILLSAGWSIRMYPGHKMESLLYLLGNAVYAAILVGVTVLMSL